MNEFVIVRFFYLYCYSHDEKDSAAATAIIYERIFFLS